VPADTPVLASGSLGDDYLNYDLHDRMPEAYLIADALAPRRLIDTLLQATLTARKI
jgi:hypothetical protein